MTSNGLKAGKKDIIIAATIKLWRQTHSINKVSLAEVANEAGVSPTTIYNNFRTREGLVQEVIRHLTQEIMENQQALLKSDLPFPVKMQRMVSIKLNTARGMQSDIIDKIWTDPSSRQYVEEITEKQAKPLTKAIIEQGQREGYIHPDIPVEMILLYFDILLAGGEANKGELVRAASDKRMIIALARLMYFGMFRKEFDVDLNEPGKEKGQ